MSDDLDPAAVEPLDLDGGLPDVYYDIRSRNDEWTTATGPVPRSTYLMDTEVLLLLVARLEAALTTARPTCCDPTTVRERIDGHWLVEEHQHHTCGAGPGSGAGHEPGCGLVPVVDLRGLPGWGGLIATARRDALTEAADAAFKDKSVQGLARVTIGTWLRARAAQEEDR